MIRHGVMGRVWPAVFFVVFVMVTYKVCVCVCLRVHVHMHFALIKPVCWTVR